MKPTRHRNSGFIKAWLDGANVQYRRLGYTAWLNVTDLSDFALTTGYEFRLKPRTFPIGEWEAPVPETTAPQEGQQYHAPDLVLEGFTCSYTWRGDSIDQRLLARGLLHLTREAAFQHGRALAAFSENIENA